MSKPSEKALERYEMLKQGEQYGNISVVCRDRMVPRSYYYKWKKRHEGHGMAGLEDRSPRRKSYNHAIDKATLAQLKNLTLKHPDWGCKRLGEEPSLNRRLSEPTVRKYLQRISLLTREDRWVALDRPDKDHSLFNKEQRKFIGAMNPAFRDRRRVCKKGGTPLYAGTAMVGKFIIGARHRSKGVKVFAQIAVDVKTGYLFSRLCTDNCDENSAKKLFEKVFAHFDQCNHHINSVCFCRYFDDVNKNLNLKAYVKTNGIKVTQIRSAPDGRKRALGLIENAVWALQNDFYDSLECRKILDTAFLKKTFQEWVSNYNKQLQDGFPCYGKSPDELHRHLLKPAAPGKLPCRRRRAQRPS